MLRKNNSIVCDGGYGKENWEIIKAINDRACQLGKWCRSRDENR